MRIVRIDLDGDEKPSELTVSMTVAEAATIATLTGQHTPVTDEISSVYYGLSGGFFNRFWEDGVAGAAADHGIALAKESDRG